MGRYLDILKRAGLYDKNDQNDKSAPLTVPVAHEAAAQTPFGRICRFGRTLSALEAHCPELVPVDRWRLAVEDGRCFLARWGEQAHDFGWTSRDLFGLHRPPSRPHPSCSRLSRYDDTGLVWLLQGRAVVALTSATAAIQSTTGAVTMYRRLKRPALGPLGDSLDDLEPPFGARADKWTSR